jgi:hypothetical protein
MPEKASPSTAFICIVAGLFTIAASNTANATECFPGPDFKPAPGTRWQYRIDSATNQGCWYIQDLGESSRRRDSGEVTRSSRSVPVSSWTSESAATSGASRSNSGEETPAAASQSSIMAWFSSTFGSLTSSPDAYSTTKTGVAATSAPSATLKRQQSKSERQTKVAQHKSEREQSESARMQDSIISILEAAGDKPVLSPPILRGQDLQRAIEAIGDKDVVIAPTDPQEDWQQALYEEFLRWRTGQLISQ